MKYKKIAFVLGASILAMVLWFFNHFKDRTFLGEEVVRESNAAVISHGGKYIGTSMTAAGPSETITVYGEQVISFSYPKVMSISDTNVIELSYSEKEREVLTSEGINSQYSRAAGTPQKYDEVESRTDSDWQDAFIGEKSIKLFSSGFDIAPSTKVTSPEYAVSPISFVWTITPKKEGERQALVLDLNDVLSFSREAGSDNETVTSLIINEQEMESLEGGIVKLEIDVRTIWGIKRTTFDLLAVAVSIICFVLMFPLLHDVIRKKFSREAQKI